MKPSKMLNSLLGITALVAAAAVTSGCHVVGGGVVFSGGWYDVYGNYCGGSPHPGCNFYGDGSKIMDYEDPYYGPGNNLYYGQWSFYDSYGYSASYVGWGWQSPNGVIYDEFGYALNEDGEQDSKDLIAEVAKKEVATVTNAGKAFAEKYSIDATAGVQIAKTLNDWATLSKKLGRARTQADVADFSKRLYGVSLEQTTVALEDAQKGETAGLEAVNSDIAKYWGTDAQTSRKILKNWYRDQLSDYNVK
jgi:hypothetical protein